MLLPSIRTELVRAYFESGATRGIGYWAVHPADDEPLIGFCGFGGIEATPEIEIVYGLLPARMRPMRNTSRCCVG
jgi:RimJ/RimL family protein N-acetyltransferase